MSANIYTSFTLNFVVKRHLNGEICNFSSIKKNVKHNILRLHKLTFLPCKKTKQNHPINGNILLFVN